MLSIGWETYGFLESESSNQRNRERLGDEIYTWAEKAIKNGLEKVQQADECELAYYEGYVGGTIATAILVPATLEEHIAGLVVRSGVKLLGVSAKTINGVLQLSKAGRVFMESGQGWAKIWFRNKEIPLSQNQIEELKHLLDKGSIDVEESGLVAKTDDGNTFLEGLVSGTGNVLRRIDDFIPSSGTQLVGNQNKTTTILGRWVPDMQVIKGKMLPNEFNVGTEFGSVANNNGGFNFLNIPDNLANASSDFFNQYNKPWLQNAIQRGDDIVLATRPTTKSDFITATGSLKGMYAEELKFLVQQNYKPINLSITEWNTIKTWFP
jgi:hypothetical protein